ncbi:MAG TPA: SDR family NAD(P)-dependent oxidoreductase [Acidimicrobiia bacterium]|nr:SDR family NAD(P)-dependent oxidoreductase [Acidimicrobiia bacterium]
MGMQVAGSTILVTGASSGIGAALAPMLAERGATVGVLARRADRLAEVLERCQVHAPDSRMWVADLDDVEGSVAVALEAWDAFGHLDVVVHNAAVPSRRPFPELTAEELEKTFRVNFFSPARMTMAILPRMLERDRGMIVNVSSLGGRLGIVHEAAYCATKFALCGWSECMQIDLTGTGVETRLVIPGAIDTEIWESPETGPPLYDGPKEAPEVVAQGIVDAIESDTFEHYVPDMKGIAEYKTSNIDEFLAGVAQMAADAGGEAHA